MVNLTKSAHWTMAMAGWLMCQSALANGQDDRRRQSELPPLPLPTPISQLQTAPTLPNETGGAVEMSENELLANRELLARAMLSALVYNNVDNVALLLKIYRRLPQEEIDKEMQTWAMAVLNMSEGDFFEAVRKYRQLHQKYPDNKMFAVRYGQALFANRQYGDAKTIFLAQDADIQRELSPYLEHIKRLERPNFAASGNFLADKNINNAPVNPDLGGGWTASSPESAKGIYLQTAMGKKFLLNEGVSLSPQLTLNGKFYWDAKHYNETVLRLSLGIGKESAKTSVTISPFYERTDYAGGNKNDAKLNHFSDSVGVAVDVGVVLGTRSRLTVNGELSQNLYADRKHLNGYSLGLSPTVSYYPKSVANSVVSVGADFGYTATRDKDDSYRRMGVRLAGAKEWGNLGVRASAGVAKREYLAPMPIFNTTQINDEYNASLSLWHKKIAYRTFVPRLTWQWQKTDSTVGLYSYDKNRVFVEMGGGF